MIFRWYGYFSGKSNLHCTANLFSEELRKQALRGDVELMVSCQCKIIIVMGTLVCWYIATMNTNITIFVLFIYSLLLQPKAWPKQWCWYVCIFAMKHCHIVVLQYHQHFISHHFGCFPPHSPLMNVFVLFGGGRRFIMLSDWWNGGGSIGASGHRLI